MTSIQAGGLSAAARCPLPIAALAQTFISSWLGVSSLCWLKIVLYREEENQIRAEKFCSHCAISKLTAPSDQTGGHRFSCSFACSEHIPVALGAVCLCLPTPQSSTSLTLYVAFASA